MAHEDLLEHNAANRRGIGNANAPLEEIQGLTPEQIEARINHWRIKEVEARYMKETYMMVGAKAGMRGVKEARL